MLLPAAAQRYHRYIKSREHGDRNMGIINRLQRLLRRKSASGTSDTVDQKHLEAWYDHKTHLLQQSLGPEHDRVRHALIPYEVGGGLDLYYYPNQSPGTAIATKELSPLPNRGPSNKTFRSYELVMFTPHPLALEQLDDDSHPFAQAHATANIILNLMARYAETTQLNPAETCEFPHEMDHVGGKCLIFDAYASHTDPVADRFGLLAIIEIFRSEMEHAAIRGGADLIDRLKQAKVYPYSNLDREPVA